jgi:putative SOS response-associated peptidase YedK
MTLATPPEAVAALFELPSVPDLPPRYNVAPSQPIPVVGPKADGSGRGLVLMRWGFVPRWAKAPDGPHPINAKAETLLERPMFREAFRMRRCLIPADGWYEWAKAGPKKQPYHFRRRDRAPFALAGLWDRWDGPGGPLLSCCVLTTEANELAKPVHDRMPVLIDPGDFGRWLDPGSQPDTLRRLLRPYPSELLEAVAVGTRVNNPKFDGPECLAPAA